MAGCERVRCRRPGVFPSRPESWGGHYQRRVIKFTCHSRAAVPHPLRSSVSPQLVPQWYASTLPVAASPQSSTYILIFLLITCVFSTVKLLMLYDEFFVFVAFKWKCSCGGGYLWQFFFWMCFSRRFLYVEFLSFVKRFAF